MPLAVPRLTWVIVALVVVANLTAGCPRVLYLDYHPSTSIKGSGEVQVESFVYSGHPTGLMKKKEVESAPSEAEALFLSQDISEFFTNAVKSELTFAGYRLQPAATRIISGTIGQFFLEYVGAQDQRFQLDVAFHVAGKDAAVFQTACDIDRQQTRDWMKTGILIEQSIKQCIAVFMKTAQSAGAL